MKILKFYADWCGPCKQQTKILAGLREGIEVEDIDVDEETPEVEELLTKYSVRRCPTMILLDDNNEVLERFSGLTLLDDINKVLDKHQHE